MSFPSPVISHCALKTSLWELCGEPSQWLGDETLPTCFLHPLLSPTMSPFRWITNDSLSLLPAPEFRWESLLYSFSPPQALLLILFHSAKYFPLYTKHAEYFYLVSERSSVMTFRFRTWEAELKQQIETVENLSHEYKTVHTSGNDKHVRVCLRPYPESD